VIGQAFAFRFRPEAVASPDPICLHSLSGLLRRNRIWLLLKWPD